jgi:hypothetical protein
MPSPKLSSLVPPKVVAKASPVVKASSPVPPKSEPVATPPKVPPATVVPPTAGPPRAGPPKAGSPQAALPKAAPLKPKPPEGPPPQRLLRPSNAPKPFALPKTQLVAAQAPPVTETHATRSKTASRCQAKAASVSKAAKAGIL